MRWNLFDLPEEYSSFESSKVVVLPISYEVTASYLKGTKDGPKAIVKASHFVELYDEELNGEPCKIGIHTIPEIASGESPESMIELISSNVSKLCDHNKFIIALGGEHSITIGIIKGLKDYYPNLSVLLLDAHADLRDEYEGTRFSHACVSKRVKEMLPITIAGVRSLSTEEARFIEENEVNIHYAKDMQHNKDWQNEVISSLSENIYLSIDLDVFDPSIIPAVGTPEPGGLDWYEMIDFLKQLSQERHIVGFDLAELCPKPGLIASDFTAAKLIYKLLGYIYANELR